MARIRREVGAGDDELVRVTEYLKPGIEELCAVVPPPIARGLRALVGSRRRGLSLRVRTHTVTGHLMLRALARLRRLRRRSERFRAEQALVERWLESVRAAAAISYDLALEVVECASLNKGYAETFERGRGSFLKVIDEVVAPALVADDVHAAIEALRRARKAALADPAGAALALVLVAPPAPRAKAAVQPTPSPAAEASP